MRPGAPGPSLPTQVCESQVPRSLSHFASFMPSPSRFVFHAQFPVHLPFFWTSTFYRAGIGDSVHLGNTMERAFPQGREGFVLSLVLPPGQPCSRTVVLSRALEHERAAQCPQLTASLPFLFQDGGEAAWATDLLLTGDKGEASLGTHPSHDRGNKETSVRAVSILPTWDLRHGYARATGQPGSPNQDACHQGGAASPHPRGPVVEWARLEGRGE